MTYEPSEKDARLVTVRTRACIQCREPSFIQMPLSKYRLWLDGESIQNVMPEWSAAERELLLSGTHEECWNLIFPPDEEEMPF